MKRERASRGRQAEVPKDIPPRGWLDIAWRVIKRFGSDNVSLIAAGLAMYGLLSIFPALAVLVSIYGLFATPADVVSQMNSFASFLPPGAWDIISRQLQSIASQGQGALSAGVAVGAVLSLWSARSAMSSLMTATNIAYNEREKRGIIMQTLLSLLFTLGGVVGFLIMLLLGVLIPVVLQALGASQVVQIATDVARWALLWALIALALAVIYRYAPAREHASWRWVTWGSAIAATLWLIASVGFGLYVRNFGSYGKTYGALGSVIVLLMWFYISSVIIVLGAEINAEMERQTKKDTTVRGGAPLGERGAYAADTVGPSAGD
jgi:membrane protein